ncbi:hypothetical protein DFP90_101748 [Aestuariispira insulae]|uniref:Flagellar protein FliL n=2 Tax=Aestuariispira insulae TaxID=1461337 RepID=A0A3D9HX04_9PROT|nr:hypothetical protein DFP90_101748 [Aestuariispira insulae]
MPPMVQKLKRLLSLACLMLALGYMGGHAAYAEDDDGEALPTYYPLPGLAVQYESKNCGYRTVVIEAQLQLADAKHIERVTAYSPRIMADLYAAVSRYLDKNKKINDNPVKQIIKTVSNKTLGRGQVTDVLIMNVLNH